MNLETIIYLIILIISVIAGISLVLFKKKVRQISYTNSEDDTHRLSDIDAMLDNINKKEIREEIPEIVSEHKPEIKHEENEAVEYFKEKKTIKKKNKFDKEEIKNAVIYSSILERKKFKR